MTSQKWIGRAALAALVSLAAHSAQAAPAFSSISQQDFDNIGRELAANSMLHNVMPASSLGSIFGFELGLVGGITQTPKIEELVKRAQPSTEVSMIPHAGLIGALTVPLGITGMFSVIPEIEAEGAKYSQFAAAVQWQIDEVVPVLPVNLAVRGFLAKSDFSFTQTINNASTGNVPQTVNVTHEGRVLGVQLLASPKIPIIEPYIGVGYLSGEGDMNISGSASATFFTFTSAQSAETKPTSSQLLAGLNVRLLLLVLGAEYSRAFDTSSVTAKVSFRF